MRLLNLHTAARHIPGLLDAARVLWLLPHRVLAAFAVGVTTAATSILAARSSVGTRRSLAERAALSGQGLSLASVQFGRRNGASPTMCLTERDLRLMAQLLDVNYLTTSHLVILGWGASRLRAAQKRLKVLHDVGYIDRFRPVRKEGSAEWIYRLSRNGWKALVAEEMTNGSTRFKQAAFTSIGYTEHDLQLSSLDSAHRRRSRRLSDRRSDRHDAV